jgi:Fe2+ transport system protein FeoA
MGRRSPPLAGAPGAAGRARNGKIPNSSTITNLDAYRPILQSGAEPVGTLPEGALARVAGMEMSPRLARRLRALGLRPGCRVQVFQRRGHGCVLAVGPTRVAIGTDLAARLWVVRELEGDGASAADGAAET